MKFYYYLRLRWARQRFERADDAFAGRTVEELMDTDMDVVVEWFLARSEMVKWLEKLT